MADQIISSPLPDRKNDFATDLHIRMSGNLSNDESLPYTPGEPN